MSDSTSMIDGDDGDLHDPVLQRALRNAPDLAVAPEGRLGEAIRAMAHEAVAPSLPEGRVGAQRPWWQRFLGIGAGGGRLPRNAAFATVLLGVLVTATWHQQEIPDARLDSDAPTAAPSRSEPAAPRSAPAVPAPPAAPVSPAAPAAEPAMQPPTSAPVTESASEKPAPSTLEAALAESRAVAEAAARVVEKEEQARQRQAARVRQAETDAAAALARLQGRPPPSAFTPAPAPRAPVAAMPPAAAAPPPPQADTAVATGQRAPRALEAQSGLAQRGAVAQSAGVAPDASAKMRAEAGGGQPTFSALSQWTRLRISRAGRDSRSLARAEARDLGALVGSAALAGVGGQPMSGSPDWRIALERNGEVMAVLELAGGQVRWRENGAAPGTGSPGTGALAALREALEEAAATAPPPASAAPAR